MTDNQFALILEELVLIRCRLGALMLDSLDRCVCGHLKDDHISDDMYCEACGCGKFKT